MTPPATRHQPRSWPLLTLAATSFIPVFGFVLAAAAVTWGLLSDRPRTRLAIGIGVAGAVFQVAGMALLLWVLRDNPAIRDAQVASVSTDLARITVELEAYRVSAGRYPASLQQLVSRRIPARMVNIMDFSAGLLRPRPYQYHPAQDGRTYKLFAAGPDGQPGTSDDIYPSPPDSAGAN